jgi:hypothetical protein
MLELQAFEPAFRDDWDAFVRDHPLAGYGHLSGNFDLAAATPGVRNRSLVVRDGGSLVAVLPLFEQDARVLRAIPVRTLASGAFFPAGPLISSALRGKAEASALSLLLDGVRDGARAARIDRVLVAHPNITAGQPTVARIGYSPLLHYGYRAKPGVGLVLDLSQSVEHLAAGRNSGCRQRINKAQNAGAVVAPIRDRGEWLACYAMNVQTLGSLALSREQFGVIWDRFIEPGHAAAYGVHADGALAAAITVIRANGAAYYWHGWRAEQTMAGANHLGLWSAILASREAGCLAFELGSVEFENPKNIGISQFKQSFGGTPFQTMAAALELRPLKAAAIALAEAAIAAARVRRRVPAPAPAPAPLPAVAVRT